MPLSFCLSPTPDDDCLAPVKVLPTHICCDFEHAILSLSLFPDNLATVLARGNAVRVYYTLMYVNGGRETGMGKEKHSRISKGCASERKMRVEESSLLGEKNGPGPLSLFPLFKYLSKKLISRRTLIGLDMKRQ